MSDNRNAINFIYLSVFNRLICHAYNSDLRPSDRNEKQTDTYRHMLIFYEKGNAASYL